jgi:hypothetical protein
MNIRGTTVIVMTDATVRTAALTGAVSLATGIVGAA